MTTELLRSFFAGIFLFNAIPHLAQGIAGQQFQSPFAKPPGVGLSSALVNVLWGWSNIFIGLGLGFYNINTFSSAGSSVAFICGGLLVSLGLAWHFGKLYAPE